MIGGKEGVESLQIVSKAQKRSGFCIPLVLTQKQCLFSYCIQTVSLNVFTWT